VSTENDFVIEVDGGNGHYRVHVRSPAGENTADLAVEPGELLPDLRALEATVLASAPPFHTVPAPSDPGSPQTIGAALFRAVLSGQAGALFLASRHEIEQREEQLRLVLRLPPDLAVLPWELLFDEERREFLCRRNTLVRYVDVPEPVRPLQVQPPLQVLCMAALPGDLAHLDAAAEIQNLRDLLAPLIRQGLVNLEVVRGETWQDLQAALYRGCHVFHFIGHGGFDAERGEGRIAFADPDGLARPVPAAVLAELLSIAALKPRLVVLSTCQSAAGVGTDVFSSTAATLVRRTPAVVAMQFAITDAAAKAFSAAFYEALIHNRGVDEAVRSGRIALTGWHTDTLEWCTPVLYMRSRDTHLFQIGSGPGTPPQTRVADAPAAYDDDFRYDAYLSYVEQEPDLTWVWDVLVPRLEASGLRIAVSGDVDTPGVARVANVQRGVEQSRRTVIVLSAGYLRDGMAHFENVLAQSLGIEEGTYRLLPVTIAGPGPDVRLPIRLGILTILDLAHPRFAERNFQRLLQALHAPLPRHGP
jgi:hypothetical protein